MNAVSIARRALVVLLLGVTLLLGLVTSCARSETTWDRIRQDSYLQVGLDPTYPPFEQAFGDHPRGIDVDLAQAIADELGLNVRFKYFGYDGLYDALATQQVDVLISALVRDPSRMRDFGYSLPYFNSGLVLLSRGDLTFVDAPDLGGKSISAELGASGHVLANSWRRQVPDLEVTTYASVDETLAAFAANEVDAAIVDHASARIWYAHSAPLADQIHFTEVEDEPYVIVVRTEDDELLEALNGALLRVQSSGQLDRILNEWFGN